MPNQIAFYPKSSGGGSGSLIPIQKQVLAVAASSVTFSAIPATFTDLLVIANAKGSGGSTQTFGIQVNGDTSALYTSLVTLDNAGTLSGVPITAATFGTIGALASSSGVSALKVTIPNYSAAVFTKSMLGECSAGQGAATGFLEQSVVNYGSTAAITSITFVSDGGITFAAGSTFTLYGLG